MSTKNLLTSDGPGRLLIRRLLPASIAVLVIVGFLRSLGERAGLYGTGAGIVLNSGTAIVLTAGLVWYFARWLDRNDRARRKAEAELRRTSRYFELSRDLVCTAGFDGVFRELNAAWTDTLGWSDAELRSRPFVEFVHPDDRERTAQESAGLAVGGVSVDFVNRYATKDGGWRWLDWRAMAALDEGLIYASARDVTQRKAAEAAAEASARETRQILESAHEAFISIDGHGMITGWNPQAEATFGWPCEEALGRELAETIIPPAYRSAHRKGIARFLATGEGPVIGKTLELSALHRDGREFPVEFTISLLRTEDGYAFNAFLRDITERKRMESELEATRDQALEASRLKSDFLATMSHEIRTPMNGVIGMTGMLLDTELDPEQKEYAETVRGSAEALLSIINEILDFSKIEAGKMELELLDFDLRNVVEDVVDLVAERAHGKGLEMVAVIEPEVPVTVRGDPGRLRQVLVNLLGNAIKFTERGEVAVKVSVEEQAGSETLLRFEVTDTGIGIAADRAAALFEPFSQADASTTRTHGGTGLGLAISRRLVELMGGQIGVRSTPGEGSCFWFTAALEPRPEANPRPAPREDLRGLRVLVVDDNATNRRILEQQVGSWGMHAALAEDATRALQLLRAAAAADEPYDVAVLDMEMPGMDGIELARAIKADRMLPPMPLVLLTSSGVRGSATEARDAGFSAFLTKPTRQSRLYDALATVMGSPQAQPELVTRDTISAARSRARPRLLIAEDNTVNQQVAVGMLRRIGYRTDVVANGAEAVEAVSRTTYGAVLMDCQMPEMDGFEATREIRRREGTGRHTPIIAMTAGAMQGDREACREAGMDDYISKPVAMETLEATLKRWVLGETESCDAPRQDGALTDTALDPDRISALRELQRDGAPDIVGELFGAFFDELPTHLTSLGAALAAQDVDAVKKEAHSLKGASANLGASRLAALAAALEVVDGPADLPSAAETLSRFRDEVDSVRTAIDAVVNRPED